MRRTAAAVLLAVALLVSSCTANGITGRGGAFVFVSPGGQAEFSYPAGQRGSVADFTGTSVTDADQTIKLSDYPDTIMVLNVWGSWCGPCRGEAEDLNVAQQLSADRPVQFLGINVQDSRQAAADFMASFQTQFPSIFDPTMRTLLSMQNFPTSSIPTTIILDREHLVARIFLRVVTAEELDRAVIALLAESNAEVTTGSLPDPANLLPSTSEPTDAAPSRP